MPTFRPATKGDCMRYRVVNWSEYQHYKDRCPPWIKLHQSLMSSEVWIMANDATRCLLIASMVLASKSCDGSFNGDAEYVKRYGHLNAKPDFKPLLSIGFLEIIEDASTALASSASTVLAFARSREERREETEERRDREPLRVNGHDLDFSSWPCLPGHQILDDWMAMRKRKRSNVSQTVINRFAKQLHLAVAKGLSVDDCLSECVTRSWQGFEAAWMESKPRGEAQAPWWSSNEGIQAKGREIGMQPRSGEGWPDFKARIQQHLQGANA